MPHFLAHLANLAWPAAAAEAIALQQQLRREVSLEDDLPEPRLIAGVDCSYDIKANTSRAVVVLMDAQSLTPRDHVVVDAPTVFPYVPGLLSFREIPVILQALAKISTPPDCLMVDGQGVAHPRRLGIAAHLGVLTRLPALGVAKSRLVGTFRMPGNARGDQEPLMDKDEQIGIVLRSKPATNPLFISAGHRMSHATAVRLTLQCLTRYRLPEPTRMADKISKQRETQNAQRLLPEARKPIAS